MGGEEMIQLNDSLIPSQAPSSGQGASYEWIDNGVQTGLTYYFWLEDVDLNGESSLYGPVSATVNVPTAVTLQQMEVRNGRAGQGREGQGASAYGRKGERVKRRNDLTAVAVAVSPPRPPLPAGGQGRALPLLRLMVLGGVVLMVRVMRDA
jgi:hypothetical protein